jgi:gluconate 2-dehydrogenase subunit 3-like protein
MQRDMSDQTRRSWMVTISQTAVGLGLSGRLQAAVPHEFNLPPGLYEPSSNHLGHALMSAEPFHPMPPGCPTDYVRPRTGPFTSLFFTASEFALVRRLTDLLIGEVSGGVSQELAEWIDLRVSNAGAAREAALRLHPLHRELAVAYYGAARVEELETSDPATACREGLVWINDAATKQHSKKFLLLDTEQQLAILDAVSDERPDTQTHNPGTRVFDFLKAETIKGFYTSRAGLKELDYKGNAFYARSPGCQQKRT